MFNIYADGKSIYEPIDDELIINSPKLTLEMGKAGSLQFAVPPSHRYYSLFQQLKTIVTVELDGVEIFRGRVLTNNRNFNNVRTIYCEGNLSYLVDSVQQGKKFKGTTHELFRTIIQRHNARVESEKEFSIGTINIEDQEIILDGTSEALETTDFDYEQIVLNSIVDDWQTSFEYIETCLIDYCGGYLRTRRVGNINYIDLVTDYGNTAVQEIEFGTNLLDLTEEISAEDVFTVLIPLGDDNLTIADVNNGSDELVDSVGVERFGRIVKTHVFDNVNTASTLLENAKRFMASHVNMPIVITAKAVDMHLLDKNVREIYVGDRVHVNSLPHNIADYLTCTKIEYDLDNPANNTYTFGNPRQTMTEHYRKDKAKANKDSKSRGGKGGGAGAGAADEEAKKNLDEFFDAWINVDKNAAHIDLGTLYKKYSSDRETLESFCGISLDAPSGNINIKTLRKEFDELGNTVTEQSAYIDLLNNELGARIDLVASRHQELSDRESTHYAEMTLFANETEARIEQHTKHLDKLDGQVTESSTNITQLSNELKAQIALEVQHKKEIDGKITSSNAKIDQVATDLKAQITLEARHKKSLDESIASIQVTADALGSEIKLKANKTTLNSNITTINSKITTINSDITEINSKITKMDEVIANKINAALIASKDIIVGNIVCGNITAFSINVPGIFGRMTYGGQQVATQDWVNGKGYLDGLPSSPTFTHVKATDGMSVGIYKVATEYWCNITKKFATQEWVLQQLANYSSRDHTHNWNAITNKPSTFAPAPHTHSFSASTTLAWGHVHTTPSNFKAGNNTGGVNNYSTKTISISGTTGKN